MMRKNSKKIWPPIRDTGRLALKYAEVGFPVVPLHGLNNDRCTCGDRNCKRPGKHPRPKLGIADATLHREEIRRMWKKWPNAKIGIIMGWPGKLLALRTDGPKGRQTLRAIAVTQGKVQRTVTIRDHDRRLRLFRVDGKVSHSRDIADGVRILGDAELIVAPSTLTRSNKRRFVRGRAPGEVDIARAPDWLLNIPKTNAGAKSSANPHQVTAGPSTSSPTPRREPSVLVVRTSEIEPERIVWVWPGTIASGRVTGLVGYPGLGKSQVAMDIAATVSTGRQWPGGAANGNPGDVIILSAEDDVAHTIVPRLIAAGADRTRVHLVKAIKGDDGVERAFSLRIDLDRLEKDYDLGLVQLVMIDPVSAYLGAATGRGINRNNGADVRTILDRLAMFAARHDLGVLAITHLNKASGAKAITRIAGSLEWVAAPRAVFVVTEEAGTGRRLLLPLKNNLAPDRTGYAFEIENKVVADGIRTSAVLWCSDPVTISADEALAAAAKRLPSGAIDFLQAALREGPVEQTEIVRRGKEAGFTEKNLRTAREKLGATTRKEGFGAGGKWVWVPAGGATVLQLVRDNEARKKTPSDNGELPDSGEGCGQVINQPDQPENGPDGGNVASSPKLPIPVVIPEAS
jgi:putative DNA primase/helicase